MSMVYINTQGAWLRKSGGRFVVMKGEEELSSIPESSVDGVVLMGSVQVSTQAVHELLEQGIPVMYLSQGGHFKGMLQPGYPRNVFLRLAQYEASLNADFAVSIAREVVRSKLSNQLTSIRKWRRNGWTEEPAEIAPEAIGECLVRLDGAANVAELMGFEAQASRCYFDELGAALPAPFTWEGRNRQPPKDPVNALLSLTYMMVTGECVSACYVAGLDPFVGFLHQLDYGRPSLALDLIEPLRSVFCDHFVLRILQAEVFTAEHFVFTDDKGCRLKPGEFARYLDAYESFVHGGEGSYGSGI